MRAAWVRLSETQLFRKLPEEEFEKAWTLYSIGKIKKSQELLDQLKERKVSEKVLANICYLQGLLLMREKQDPSTFFEKAIRLYPKEINRLYVWVNFAYYYIHAGQLDEARFILEAHPWEENPFYWETYAELEFYSGDYQLALIASREAHRLYEEDGNKSGAIHALSNIGFYEILVGDTEKGIQNTLRAQSAIVEIGDEDRYFWNLANFTLICGNDFYGNQIREFGEREGDMELLALLDYTEAIACLKAKGEGEPPPPPPPG